MDRWQALVAIVHSFNERGRPALALSAIGIIIVVPLLVWAAIAVTIGQSSTVKEIRSHPPNAILRMLPKVGIIDISEL